MRESWRNHRSAFESTLPPDTQCAVVLIFVGKDFPARENWTGGWTNCWDG